ncbi:MAG: GNAT family N-acetyltransferase [Alphaproteobacteria bacterium]|nr:GNAT family N-acetyltransferase [Alphaproteobacteria bacterium]
MAERLVKKSIDWDEANVTRCFVTIDSEKDIVVGYYTLSAYTIDASKLPAERFKKRFGLTSMSMALIGKLATRSTYQRQGIGEAMIYDAAKRVHEGPMAAHSLVLHVKDRNEDLLGWYIKQGFSPLHEETHYLFMPISRPLEALNKLKAQATPTKG